MIQLIFWWRRVSRLLYPSPAEVRFIRLMKGRVLIIPFVRSGRSKFPLAIALSMGYLKRELVEREIWVNGRYCLDFATPRSRVLKAIEIDGRDWHRDVVREQQRDEYLRSQGWQVLHVKAIDLWRKPREVYVTVNRFLKS
jgi:hypothetical protein